MCCREIMLHAENTLSGAETAARDGVWGGREREREREREKERERERERERALEGNKPYTPA